MDPGESRASPLMDDAQFRLGYKIDNMLDLVAHRHLVLDHQQGIENARVALINDPIGVAHVLDHLVGIPLVLEDHGIDAIVARRLLRGHDIGRNILTETAARLDHGPTADATPLAHQHVTPKDDAILQLAITRKLTAIP